MRRRGRAGSVTIRCFITSPSVALSEKPRPNKKCRSAIAEWRSTRCSLTCEVFLPPKEANIGFGVHNFLGLQHGFYFLGCEPARLNAFVIHWFRFAGGELRRQIDRHFFVQESDARIKLRNSPPLLC